LFLLSQLRANDLARVAQHLQQEPDLFIDRFRRRTLPQAILLESEDRSCVNINCQFGSKKTRDMPKSILGKPGRAVPKPVTDQVFIDDLFQASDSLLTDFAYVVESRFQFTPPLLLRRLGNCFRRGF
jgi:hypothetical protein